MNKAKKRRQLERLYRHDSTCHWCKRPMLMLSLTEKQQWPAGRRFPENMATIDHLYSRLHPARRAIGDGKTTRHVLACYKCNQYRSQQEMVSLYKAEHIRRTILGCKSKQLVLQFPHDDGSTIQTTHSTRPR